MKVFGVLLIAICVRSSASLYRAKDVFSCFVLHSNEFLEKSGNVLIEDINDINECLRKCMQAPISYKFVCRTVMYNVNSGNCVLSKYGREERKVKKSKGLQIDLYENKCPGNESEKIKLAVYNEQVRTTSAPLTIRSFNPSVVLTTTTTGAPTTNELRRVHAVKSYPLNPRKENVIFSKTIYAEASKDQIRQLPRLPQKFVKPALPRTAAKVFINPSGRPLVDSTSVIQSPPPSQLPPQNQIQQQFQHHPQMDVIQARRQRSDAEMRLEDLAPCFIKTSNKVLPKYEEVKLSGLTWDNCIRQCAQSTNFYCASINYSYASRTCILNGGNVHLNGDSLIVSRDFDYYENRCQPRVTTTPKSLSGVATKKECYRLYNNSIYNSFEATIVGGLPDLESCEAECSWSLVRRREKCLGLNWIVSTQGCMLYHRPTDLNLLQPSFKSIFLMNTCTDHSEEHATIKSPEVSTRPAGSDYYDT